MTYLSFLFFSCTFIYPLRKTKNLTSMKNTCLFVVLAVALFACQPDNPTASVVELPEIATIDVMEFEPFRVSIEKFVGTLSAEQYQFLSNYVAKISTKRSSSSNRSLRVSCTCLPDQATCDASAASSECCICCAAGSSASCGTYVGVAFCKCEGGGRQGRQEYQTTGTVTFYPRDVDQLISFAETNNFNVVDMRQEFNVLVSNL